MQNILKNTFTMITVFFLVGFVRRLFQMCMFGYPATITILFAMLAILSGMISLRIPTDVKIVHPILAIIVSVVLFACASYTLWSYTGLSKPPANVMNMITSLENSRGLAVFPDFYSYYLLCTLYFPASYVDSYNVMFTRGLFGCFMYYVAAYWFVGGCNTVFERSKKKCE